ncbi:MAG TPA: hypothetical protein VL916_08050 [Ilumatobacteraceae bacterium]|nr:hypothetical protein [Ilumatobacteraceae bacterium]
MCGNGFIDDGELCDDGNVDAGDGCGSTCTSTEVCGDALAELDEECDCGDAAHPGSGFCDGTVNGQTVCTNECTRVRTLSAPKFFPALGPQTGQYLFEGTGFGTPHQPVPVYVDGLAADDVVAVRVPAELGSGWEVCGQAVSGEVAVPIVAPCARGERSLAFTVSVPISTTVGAGGTVSPLEVVVTRGARVYTLPIQIVPLNELTSGLNIQGLFSRAQITAPVVPAKDAAVVVWRVIGDIEIGALVDLRGTAGMGSTLTTGCNTTGCAGGLSGPGNTQDGASTGPSCTATPCSATAPLGGSGAVVCTAAGGCGSLDASSAGGGGYATTGAVGTSACAGDLNKAGGAGGAANSDPYLVASVTGGGGGGGGATMFGSNSGATVVYGGGGGGGGGAIVIDTLAELRFLAGGQILANGGSGGAGGYTTCSGFPNHHQAGDGGGGAGGAIRIRAQTIAIPAAADIDNILVAAGGTSVRGGAGANGRTRVDGLGVAVDTLNTAVAGVVRGPDFTPPLPIVRTDSVSVAARSRSTGAVLYYGSRAASADRYVLANATTGAGTVTLTIPLEVGLNEVCVLTGPQSDSLVSAIIPAAKRCTWIARVP